MQDIAFHRLEMRGIHGKTSMHAHENALARLDNVADAFSKRYVLIKAVDVRILPVRRRIDDIFWHHPVDVSARITQGDETRTTLTI